MLKGIDLFAGAGGNTIAGTNAGIEMVYAANHWQMACDIHRSNHPSIEVACQDLQQADWSRLPAHDIGLASPCCQGHSKARGKERAHHDTQRNTAWAVVGCAEYHKEDVWLVENVVDFLDWPLFPSWLDAMRRLGYAMAPYIIDSADHGVPQHRERVYMVFTRSKHPIELTLPKRPHVPVSSVIEWESYNWSKIEKTGRSPKTLARVKSGRERFGDRFVFPYYSSGSGKTGRSLDRPLGTVTTVDRWAIVQGDMMRMFQPSEYRKVMNFPENYLLPSTRREAIKMLGNAVTPIVPEDLLNEIQRVA
ncbi:DNA cytosine methyltransferase [Aliagarivorans taiwanensis]|uniref:DNA cytosine methyltransferase n=1 Tax=Aliagarivorans taiwanensis TaxID=561966 RepID=UPI0004050B5F|nr:DNA cytosine methyltransferase [Aliagarivorans taiwanensis]